MQRVSLHQHLAWLDGLQQLAQGLNFATGISVNSRRLEALLQAFTTFAVQHRYEDDPEDLSLDRELWCRRAEELIARVEQRIG